MNLKLNHRYRFCYNNQRTGDIGCAYASYMATPAIIESKLEHLRILKRDYPRHTFWIEESKDGNSWAKLTDSKYALFSED